MTEREKMLAGELYDCGDKELLDRWHRAKNLVRDYNQTDSDNLAEKDRILGELLGGRGDNLWITRPLLCGLRKQYLFWQQLRSEYELHLSGR